MKQILIGFDEAGTIGRILQLHEEDVALQSPLPGEAGLVVVERLPAPDEYWDGNTLAPRTPLTLTPPLWAEAGGALTLTGLPANAVLMDARTRTLHSADSTGVLTLTAPNAPDTLMLAPSGAHSGALVTIPVHTLESARAEAWQTLKQARAQQIAEPLNTHYGVFDADAPAQQSLIQAAAQAHTVQAAAQVAALAAAQAAGTTPAPERMQNWTLDWTLADNSAVALDAKALLDVTGALFERTQALHQRTQQLRAALEAASSVAEVMALKAAGLKLEPNNPLK